MDVVKAATACELPQKMKKYQQLPDNNEQVL